MSFERHSQKIGNYRNSGESHLTLLLIRSQYHLPGEGARSQGKLCIISMLTCRTRYTSSYAHRLAEAVHDVLPSPTKDANIAFLCCPTAYVASQYLHQPSDTLLFEFDKRFAIAEGAGRFIHYDLQADEEMPEDLKGTVELAIVDPPFLNEVGERSFIDLLNEF